MTANIPNATPSPIPTGFRKTEANAIERRERNKAPPEVRAERAAVLAENDARARATRDAEIPAAQRPVEVFRDVLAFTTDAQLEKLHRSVGRIDGRSQQAAVSKIITARARARYAAGIAASSAAASTVPAGATIPVEAPEKPASPRGRPKAR